MIYLFAGDDTQNKLSTCGKFINSFDKKMEVFSINKNNFDPVQVESLYSGEGLFFSKCVVIFSSIMENEDLQNSLLEKLDFMRDSENIFIFLEGKLNKPIIDDFKKARAEINIFELSKEKKEKFNNFLLANAFGNRDKLNLWIYFRQAIDAGVGMEELVGVLFWKAKDMILRSNFSKFSETELKDFVTKISYLLPEARKEGFDDESAFEQFLLEVF